MSPDVIMAFGGITKKAYYVDMIRQEHNTVIRFQRHIDKIKLTKNVNKIYFKNLKIKFDQSNVSGTISIYNKQNGVMYSGIITKCDKDNNNLMYMISNRPIMPILTEFSGIIQIEICVVKKNC